MPTDTIVLRRVEYDDDADLDVGSEGVIENHDELVDAGKTTEVIICLNDTEEARKYIADGEIIEPGDEEWCEEYADLKPNERIPLAELRES